MSNEEIINHLLNIMLNTVLNSAPYPGQDVQQTFFPDIEVVQKTPEIILSDENLSETCCFEVPGYKICVVSQDQLVPRAAEQGDYPYLTLTEAQLSDYTGVLTLQLKWAISKTSQEMGKYYFGGGGVRVKFILENGEWVSPTGPMATWMS